MASEVKKYIDLFSEFSEESFKWCKDESESATSRVSKILDIIVEDADRVSQMSEETIKALETMKEIISSLATEQRDIEKANKLSQALAVLSNENMQVQEMIQPMLEALQFQDRITQNMDNFKNIMKQYVELRNRINNGETFDDIQLRDFGEELLKLTTMAEERDIIRRYIDGLSNDEVTNDVLFF